MFSTRVKLEVNKKPWRYQNDWDPFGPSPNSITKKVHYPWVVGKEKNSICYLSCDLSSKGALAGKHLSPNFSAVKHRLAQMKVTGAYKKTCTMRVRFQERYKGALSGSRFLIKNSIPHDKKALGPLCSLFLYAPH